MKPALVLCHLAIFTIVRTVAADQILAEGNFDNAFVPTNGGIAFWSGGNVGAYPNGSGSIPAACGWQKLRLP